MSVCKVKSVIESWTCDYCGEEFYEHQSCSLLFRIEDDITFEYTTSGDYCPKCFAKLVKGICQTIPVAERYEKDEVKIPKERAVIDGENG